MPQEETSHLTPELGGQRSHWEVIRGHWGSYWFSVSERILLQFKQTRPAVLVSPTRLNFRKMAFEISPVADERVFTSLQLGPYRSIMSYDWNEVSLDVYRSAAGN